MKIGDYIVLGVILLWLVLAFCWMHRQKMTAMECKPCLVRMKNILYNSL